MARAKLARKGCDLLVVNDVGGGKVFGSAENEAVVLDSTGDETHVPRGSKSALAHVIWDRVAARLRDRLRRTAAAAGNLLHRPTSTTTAPADGR